MTTITALLAGATGLVGRYCLQYLLDDPFYDSVVVLARKPAVVQHAKLIWYLVDFDRLQNHHHLLRADHIFCCLGTTLRAAGSRGAFRRVDFEYPGEIARRGRESGAQKYLLVSAMTANPQSPIFYNRIKGETEKMIGDLGFPTVGIFRPSFLVGNRSEIRLGEIMGGTLLRLLSPFLSGKAAKYKPVHAGCVARAMVEIAKSDLSGFHIFKSDQIRKYADR